MPWRAIIFGFDGTNPLDPSTERRWSDGIRRWNPRMYWDMLIELSVTSMVSVIGHRRCPENKMPAVGSYKRKVSKSDSKWAGTASIPGLPRRFDAHAVVGKSV